MPIDKISTTRTGENFWSVSLNDETHIGTIEHIGRAHWRATPANNLQGPGGRPRSRAQALQHLRIAWSAQQQKPRKAEIVEVAPHYIQARDETGAYHNFVRGSMNGIPGHDNAVAIGDRGTVKFEKGANFCLWFWTPYPNPSGRD